MEKVFLSVSLTEEVNYVDILAVDMACKTLLDIKHFHITHRIYKDRFKHNKDLVKLVENKRVYLINGGDFLAKIAWYLSEANEIIMPVFIDFEEPIDVLREAIEWVYIRESKFRLKKKP